ncbi:MAG TPA: holo-ACP synthase [Thermoleophilaceae bacterium]|nr:holo-ACP synthase [Thermoleophilaceae bacterium]
MAGAPVPGGVGLDLIAIDRLEQALRRRPRLADRLFTPAERDYARARGRPGAHLAARFCAKEAVAKALALPGWSFSDVEVVATATAPAVRLQGAAAARASELGVVPLISLTHDRELAAATAVLAPAHGR